MSSYSYHRVPHQPPHTIPNQPIPPYAPRPHQWRESTLPPPPKMDKSLFDRCGNCTRAFGILSRKRHCANCGFVYCSDCCVEKFKLFKFQGFDARDARVCDYCKEFLKIDRMPNSVLTTISVRSLREYIDAYGIAKAMPFVEKSEMINAITDAEITEYNEQIFRQSTPGFRDWYKRQARNPTEPRVPPMASSNIRASASSFHSNTTSNGTSSTASLHNPPPQNPSVWEQRQSTSNDARPTSSLEETSTGIERERRPYAGSPVVPPTRPRSTNDLREQVDEMHLSPSEPAPFERRRRQYSLSSHSPPIFQDPTPESPPNRPPRPSPKPPIELREIVHQGIEISSLSTSTLLTIMRQNNCPLPVGAVEKDDLIERVEEMVSFILASPEPKQPKVRDDDEDDCKICFERVADYCLVPCGHTGFCFMCARKMESCPFCKMEVGHAQKLWKV